MMLVVTRTTIAVQVDLLVRTLEEEEGERVLIILPERYLRPCVPNSARTKRGKVRSTCFTLHMLHFFSRPKLSRVDAISYPLSERPRKPPELLHRFSRLLCCFPV